MFEKIISAISWESTIFIVAIGILTIWFHKNFNSRNAGKAPSILTTLGILGTFVGIAIGLLDFDQNDIQGSVPQLIDGIKSAFWISATGIFCALSIKIRETILGASKESIGTYYQDTETGDSAEPLEGKENSLSSKSKEDFYDLFEALHHNIKDGFDTLKVSFDSFAECVADNNSLALISALEKVIGDFNTQINEQFGENFKQLNQAVGEILVWQKKYREQMSEMIEQQTATSKNMHLASESYQNLVQNAEHFNEIASSLSDLIEGLETQRTEISSSMIHLASLINTASSGLPRIEETVVSIIEQLSTSVEKTSDEFANTLLTNIQSSNEIMLTTLQTSNKEVRDNLESLIQSTKVQVGTLDDAIRKELTQSLEIFSQQMASLSSKFVKDYTPLTENLKEILRIARNNGHGA